MSKQIVLVMLLTVSFLIAAFPGYAQQDNEAITVCTPEQQQQLEDAFLAWNLKYGEAVQALPAPQTAEDYLAAALALNDVRSFYHNETEFPLCADALILGKTIEFLLDNYLLEMQLSAFYFYAEAAGDTSNQNQLMELGMFHIEKLQSYQEQLMDYTTAIGEGQPIIDAWLPACTDTDFADETYLQILELETVYHEQREALDGFVANATMTPDLLFAVEDLVMAWEPLTDSMPLCEDIFFRSGDAGSIYYETAAALAWGAIATYSDNSEVLTARDLLNEELATDLEVWQTNYNAAENTP